METGVEEIRNEVMTLPDQAKMILVRDTESMAKGNEFFLTCRAMRKKISDFMDPIISANFQAHKIAVAKKKELEAPLIVAESWLNAKMTAYKQEQDRIRQAEEQRLRQIAIEEEMARRKAEEVRRMEEAVALEELGANEEAAQVMAEVLQEAAAPVIVTPPPPTIPKVEVKGMATATTWKFEIINESLIPRSFMTPDLVKIGGVVRSLKAETNIPGIRVYTDSKMRATGR